MNAAPLPKYSPAILLTRAVQSLAETPVAAAGAGADPWEEELSRTLNNSAVLPTDAAPEPPRYKVGDVINSRYEVLDVLGKGGMGVVYRVRDRLFPSRRVALKTRQQLAAAEGLTLFRAEFRALAELRHKNIAEVYDFEELSGQPGHLFTMELVEGQVLDAAMRERDPKAVWRAVTEMAEALAYVHGHGRLHLDIKPGNAIIAAGGTCKLLDFGLVGLVFCPGQLAGTFLYMAPEIFKGQPPDARCDLFSLGITAYQLLVGRVPYSPTTHAAERVAEKLERVVEFPAELHDHIPAFMQRAVGKLCALDPKQRFASVQDFLDATRHQASAYGIVAARVSQRLEHSTFVGREPELKQVLDFSRARLSRVDEAGGPMLCCVGAPSGLGKSRLLAEARAILQSEGHVFLQGDAYDQDVGEYTALAPVLLAASHLAHAHNAQALIDQYGPDIIKIAPGFGLPTVCQPSAAFSHGEAERERLISQAAAFLVALAQRRELALYLNDLQWAGAGTVEVLRRILQQLRVLRDARLALVISYRSDQIQAQPIARLLSELPAAELEQVRLQGLSGQEVGAVMSSMLLAAVPSEIASQMQQSTGGMPFLVEESTRWLFRQGALAVHGGVCVVKTQSGQLDLQLEVGKGIVARAALQGDEPLRCLKLLAVCARPIELEQLRHAMNDESKSPPAARAVPRDVTSVLASLEAEQLVVPVAGSQPRYALSHDRIRESLFDSLSADERLELHGRLGATFEAFLHSSGAAELSVLTAAHQNATPMPRELASRRRRCDVNLRAAEVARKAANFVQAMAFLDTSEALLQPEVWADQGRGMRLAYQRALTFGAMLRHAECLDFARQAARHAGNLVEEGQALVLAIRSLTVMTRYDEAIDLGLDFCNRLDPSAKLVKHPGLVRVLSDAIRIKRRVQRFRGSAVLARVNEREDAQRDLLYEIIAAMGDAVYLARPLLLSGLARHGLERLIGEGASPSCRGSAILVVILAAVTLGSVGQVGLSVEIGRAARSLLDSAPLETRGRLIFLVETFLRHLDEPMRLSPPMYLAAAAYCQKARDSAYEAYSVATATMQFDWLGEPLDQLNADYQKLTRDSAVLSSQEVSDWIRIRQRLRAALQGEDGPAGQHAHEAVLSNTANALRSGVQLRGAAHGVYPGPWRAKEYGFPTLFIQSMGGGGAYQEPLTQFYAGIVYLTALRGQLPLIERLHYRAAAEFVIYNMRLRARHNPTDYAHRIALLDAERLRNRGQMQSAEPLFERAARLAQANGWPGEAALALEKFTEALIAHGAIERARTTAGECIALYKRWQAWVKVAQIERVLAALPPALRTDR